MKRWIVLLCILLPVVLLASCTSPPSAAEKAGWLPATGHLYPGVVIYIDTSPPTADLETRNLNQDEPPVSADPWAVFDKRDTLGIIVHDPKGGGTRVMEWHPENRQWARGWWVRKDDPALVGHL